MYAFSLLLLFLLRRPELRWELDPVLNSDPTLAECLLWIRPTLPALDDRCERNSLHPVLFLADCGREFVDWELDEEADDPLASRGTGVPGLDALFEAVLTLLAIPRCRDRERLGGTRAMRSMLTTVVVRKESEARLSM